MLAVARTDSGRDIDTPLGPHNASTHLLPQREHNQYWDWSKSLGHNLAEVASHHKAQVVVYGNIVSTS